LPAIRRRIEFDQWHFRQVMRALDGLKSFQQLLLGARRDARLEQSMKGQTVEGRLAELNRGIDVVPFEIDRRVVCFEPQIESRIIGSEFFEMVEALRALRRSGSR
jgi:hypothetical protein